jgi:hypothetical protein
MKKLLLGITFLLGITAVSVAQNPPASPRVEVENDVMHVGYGQPSKKGRVIFGELVPYNQVWRTGANRSTDITFKKDVQFGSATVKAGTYALFTIPGEQEWTLILNSVTKQPGSAEYEKNKDKNVATIKVKSSNSADMEEKFTISLPTGKMVLHWDKTKVEVPVQ